MYRDSSALSAEPTIEVVPALHAVSATRARARLGAVDAVRGLAIVLMVLDHARDFFNPNGPSPTDIAHTNVPLFFTRWLTHFCAPTFVFLAGTSAFFVSKRLERAELRRFLLTRGAWLIVLEFTVVNFVWSFNLGYGIGLTLQVIWAIGASMCVLALLVGLPRWALLAFGLVLVAGHNLLDGIPPAQFGAGAIVFKILHVQGPVAFGFVHYPLVPWVGVMALGFAAGELFELGEQERRQRLYMLGAASLALFVALRLLNGYGDPKPWSEQASASLSALSFLNVSKYPPSLDYLTCMLGLMLLGLAWFDARPRLPRALLTFGQVPLFAYVVHLALVHLLAGLTALAMGHGTSVLTNIFIAFPKDWGVGLFGVYVAWAVTLAVLYPLCRWFAGYKRTHDAWWLSYL